MVRKNSNYNPDTYGKPEFKIIPEGPNDFLIDQCFFKQGKYGPQWQLDVHPVTEEFRKDNGKCYTFWIPEDCCVEALCDAMGKDPMNMPDQDYEPQMFEGKVISAVVEHDAKTNGKGNWANIKRLYPKWSKRPVDDDFPV